MKRIILRLRKFITRQWLIFVGDLRDFGIYLVSIYQEIVLVVFFLVFGFASGLWLAAMISGFLVFAYLVLTDFQPPRYKTATAILFLSMGLALTQPTEKSPSERLKIDSDKIEQVIDTTGIIFP